jgi:hypothetical protein
MFVESLDLFTQIQMIIDADNERESSRRLSSNNKAKFSNDDLIDISTNQQIQAVLMKLDN